MLNFTYLLVYRCTAVIYNGQCLQRCPEGTQFAVERIANFDSPVSTCTGQSVLSMHGMHAECEQM